MIHCQKCGQTNTQNSNFCRLCGSRLATPQYANGSDYEHAPPRPYAWKTGEFQVNDRRPNSTQEIKQVQPLADLQYQPVAGVPTQIMSQPSHVPSAGYRCPRCGTPAPPAFRRRVSTTGWIVFAILLAFTFVFFWIGLLIREDVRVCPFCKLSVA